MIDTLIRKYLAEGKRLVIPEFGAFIRKDAGQEVVFVEFLKSDDSVLNTLVCKRYAVGESQARAMIQDFVASIRDQIATRGEYGMEGIGILRRDATGIYELEYNPQATNAVNQISAIEESRPVQTPGIEVIDIQTGEQQAPQPAVDDAAATISPQAVEAIETEEAGGVDDNASGHEELEYRIREARIEPQPEEPKRTQEPQQQAENLKTRWEHAMEAPAANRHEQPAAAAGQPAGNADRQHPERPGQGAVSDRAGQQPRPQQPNRQQAAGSEQVRQAYRQSARPQQRRPQGRPGQRPTGRKKRNRADIIMIIAIIAALIAIGSIIFGVLTPSDPVKMLQPTSPVEQAASMPDNVADAGTDGAAETTATE